MGVLRCILYALQYALTVFPFFMDGKAETMSSGLFVNAEIAGLASGIEAKMNLRV
jgi:hypothetical protein